MEAVTQNFSFSIRDDIECDDIYCKDYNLDRTFEIFVKRLLDDASEFELTSEEIEFIEDIDCEAIDEDINKNINKYINALIEFNEAKYKLDHIFD